MKASCPKNNSLKSLPERDFFTGSRYYGHFYQIFISRFYGKSHSGKAESHLQEDGIPLKQDVFIHNMRFFFISDTFFQLSLSVA